MGIENSIKKKLRGSKRAKKIIKQLYKMVEDFEIGEYDYIFTVIMPVYNLEKYLEEALKSIITQSIGFEKKIQIVIVDDGSSDSSKEICLKYSKKFPQNIEFVMQQNQGVSAARNRGIQYARGKYVTFFDGDDCWETDAFKHVYDFFELNKYKVDMVACRRQWFEGRSGYASNDFRFKRGTRIIDIHKEPECFHVDVTSSFFKLKVVQEHKFIAGMTIGEDSRFANDIILIKEKYGLVTDSKYRIRRRNDGKSLTQTANTNVDINKSVYTDTLKEYYEYFFELSKAKYGKVIPYVQYLIGDALRYRASIKIPENLDIEIADNYRFKVRELIRNMQLDIILSLQNCTTPARLNLIKLYDNELYNRIKLDRRTAFLNGNKIGRINVVSTLFINSIVTSETGHTVCGYFRVPALIESPEIFMWNESDGVAYWPQDLKVVEEKSLKSMMDENYYVSYSFIFDIPVSDKTRDLEMKLKTGTYPVKLRINREEHNNEIEKYIENGKLIV